MTPLTDAERQRFRDEAVVPEGWRWCPDCNGEGTVSTIGADPDLTETTDACTRCEAEHGIVPEQRVNELMDNLERSVAAAKAARSRVVSEHGGAPS